MSPTTAAAAMSAPAASWASTAGQTVVLYAGHAWSAMCTAAIAIKTAAVAFGLAAYNVAAPVFSYSWGFVSQHPLETAVIGGLGIIIGLIAYRLIASRSASAVEEGSHIQSGPATDLDDVDQEHPDTPIPPAGSETNLTHLPTAEHT